MTPEHAALVAALEALAIDAESLEYQCAGNATAEATARMMRSRIRAALAAPALPGATLQKIRADQKVRADERERMAQILHGRAAQLQEDGDEIGSREAATCAGIIRQRWTSSDEYEATPVPEPEGRTEP